jgi:hypothetical protein
MGLLKRILNFVASLFGRAKHGASKALDVNGDGSLDLADVKAAGRVVADNGVAISGTVGAAVTVAAGSAAAGAAVGSAIVGAKAAAIGSAVATAAGATAGVVGGLWAGTATIPGLLVTQIGSLIIVESATLVTVSAPVVAAWTSTATVASAAAEAATGFVAGLPVVKSAAAYSAKAAGDIVMIGGVAFSVKAAIVAGLVLAVVIGGVAYYVLTKEGQRAYA